MATLKQSTAQILDDGMTVQVTAGDAATAHELAADMEAQVRRKQGPWARFNAWLGRILDRFDETWGLYEDRTISLISVCFLVGAVALAIYAWWRVLPGYEPLLAFVGATIVVAMKESAHRIGHNRSPELNKFFYAVCAFGLVIEILASSSLQASVAVEQETGRSDIESKITSLRQEQQLLQIGLLNDPGTTSEAQLKMIEAFKGKPAVNKAGTQLNKPIGELIGDCTGSSYYVLAYCPSILELEAKVETIRKFETDKARYLAIPDEIQALEEQRPKQSSTLALAQKATGGGSDWWRPLVVPVLLSLFVNGAMLLTSYLNGRARRT